MQKVNLYGELIEVTDEEALGVLSFIDGRHFSNECAPEGFVMAPEDADDEWRRGYAMAAFAISDRAQLDF